ncbi:MAG: VWA domain-containing protein [Candidatus Nanosalina sp.]
MYFEQPLYLMLSLLGVPLVYSLYSNQDSRWQIVSVSYILVIALLSVAAASPAIRTNVSTEVQRELTYLRDESRSMMDVSPEVNLNGVSVEERTLVSGNNSDIGAAMLNSLEPNQTYLVSSDFQSSGDLKQVVDSFRRMNATVHVIRANKPEEYAVAIQGPEIAVPGARSTYTINVSSTGIEEKVVEVKVDGEAVKVARTNGSFNIRRSFSSKGYHTITAEIKAEDRYTSNNRFYKVVKVIEKPEILVVGKPGSLQGGKLSEELSNYFQITNRGTVPGDLSRYYAVVLKRKLDDTSQLKSYLVDGNGLIYTGHGSMEFLPVEKSERNRSDTKSARVIVAVDISIASGVCAEETCFTRESRQRASIKPSKRLAYNIIHNLPRSTKVGIVAYNDRVYRISEPKSLAFHRDELKRKVSRLKVQGPSLHDVGLKGAGEMTGERGNIVFVTGGEITALGESKEVVSDSYSIAENLPSDVKLFTVGVGDEINSDYLSELAQRGNGNFYRKEEFYSSVPIFRGGGGAKGTEALTVVYRDHYITRNLGAITAATRNFDKVVPKPSAQLLVTSTSGKPALTTWRYGLGRVASFSAGGRELGNLLRQEPVLVARAVSWATGNPRRKENRTVSIRTGRMNGEPLTVEANFPLGNLTRKSRDLYTKRLNPQYLGFHSYRGYRYAFNYGEEIQEIEYNRQFIQRITEATGGNVLRPNEVSSISSSVNSREVRITESRSLSAYFILSALAVFLAQIGYRKRKGMI